MSENPFEHKDPRDTNLTSPEPGMEKGAILELNDREFLGTFFNETEAESFAQKYGGIVQPFGIHIMKIDPVTRKVEHERFDITTSRIKDADWTKTEGFSVWRAVKK